MGRWGNEARRKHQRQKQRRQEKLERERNKTKFERFEHSYTAAEDDDGMILNLPLLLAAICLFLVGIMTSPIWWSWSGHTLFAMLTVIVPIVLIAASFFVGDLDA